MKRHQIPADKLLRALSAGMLVFLLVLVRVIYPGSDAYARLTWSSALLTDEGFYIHNARNVVLFGHARTDEFNNALIMPLLHGLQVLVFRTWGVGAMQARSISIALSLLTLLAFGDALRRVWGARCAWGGVALLGLDPTFALYNRLALMDTPACLPLCLAFWMWTLTQEKGEQEKGERRKEKGSLFPLLLCGACLGLAYCARGLCAIVVPVPVLLLAAPLWRQWRQGDKTNFALLLCFLCGLALVLLAYVCLWYLPNRTELARVNAYYLNHQLRPDSVRHLWQNVQHAFFGDERGIAPYLFRHTPVTFTLALLCLAGQEKGERKKEKGNAPVNKEAASFQKNSLSSMATVSDQHALSPFSFFLSPAAYLRLWLLLMWAFLAIINYAPDRYYILFYPALCGLAALALCDLDALLAQVTRVWWKRAGLGGFLAYHLAEALLHHASAATDICLYAFTGGVALTLALPSWNVSQWRERLRAESSQPPPAPQSNKGRILPVIFLAAWAVVTTAWLGDWIGHISYAQANADEWLALHLPADSVLIGDAAPGLCLNNRFRVVCVIAGLCNDTQPIERFAPAPRYIVIMDDSEPGQEPTAIYKEPWWRGHYPALVASAHRIYYVPRITRFPVGIYAVPPP